MLDVVVDVLSRRKLVNVISIFKGELTSEIK
jgi:hypothetical protein